jgi:hypothetical protein
MTTPDTWFAPDFETFQFIIIAAVCAAEALAHGCKAAATFFSTWFQALHFLCRGSLCYPPRQQFLLNFLADRGDVARDLLCVTIFFQRSWPSVLAACDTMVSPCREVLEGPAFAMYDEIVGLTESFTFLTTMLPTTPHAALAVDLQFIPFLIIAPITATETLFCIPQGTAATDFVLEAAHVH